MKKLIQLTLSLSIITLSACGVAATTNNQSQSESRSYELEENGCNTGKHQFSSLSEMCDALKNDSLNHYCAYSLRRSYFQQSNCPGTF